MKRIFSIVLLATAVMITGCATSGDLIRMAGTSSRDDVFRELPDGGTIPPGYADLRVVSSLKTHKPGIYARRDPHGTAAYKLLLNIDGQMTQIQGTLKAEDIEPMGRRDPEAGEGIRYQFSKIVRLKAGTHKIVIAIPADEIAVVREITLAAGSSSNLVLEPVYGAATGKQRPGYYGVTSFQQGVKGLRVILDGKPL